MNAAVRGLWMLWFYGCCAYCAAAEPPKPLNNFVTELAGLENVPAGRTVSFANPREGWIHVAVRADGDVAGSCSAAAAEKTSCEPLCFLRVENGGPAEAMKHLPAGDFQLRLSLPAGGTIEKLTVRSVPAIFYNAYRRFSRLHECNDVARDWKFLEKHVNPHINTYIVHRAHCNGFSANAPSAEIFDEWVRRGKHWMTEVPMNFEAKTADDAYRHFLAEMAVSESRYDGFLVDEFCEIPSRKEINRVNLEALQRIADLPAFAGKRIYPYIVTTAPKASDYEGAWKFTVANHFLLSQEWYFRDMQPMENMPDCFVPNWHADNMTRWDKHCPGAAGSLIMTLAGWNLPDCSGNLDPQCDAKASLDLQMQFIAVHPAFRQVRGINVWTTSYMDEELIRWTCRLFRHYCIEGNKSRLSSDPYVLPHLVNPDFEQGTEGWNLQMAASGAIRAEQLKDYGVIQGRYAHRTAKGEHFLVARRSAAGPNVISQTVKHLTPGRLYTFRMYTADYNDLKTGLSKRQKHALSISLAGADVVPGKELHLPYCCRDSAELPPFNSAKQPCWLNYHWILFRAKSDTAELSVSDWAESKQPGGETGQELAFNFFQVAPYFAEAQAGESKP